VLPGAAGSASAASAKALRPSAAKLPQRRNAAAASDSGDDDLGDVEEILRRRGIK
jgi:hypothetical protein